MLELCNTIRMFTAALICKTYVNIDNDLTLIGICYVSIG